jgi:hypothetical protein
MFIVVVVHARISYGTNAQETKITLFGDGGDKLWAISGRRRMLWQKRNCARTPSYAHALVSALAKNERTLTTTRVALPPEAHQNWQF